MQSRRSRGDALAIFLFIWHSFAASISYSVSTIFCIYSPMSDSERTVTAFINSLTLLKPHQLADDDFCPICFIPFTDILNEPASEEAIIGITRLESCGHIFCMKEYGNCAL